MQKATKKSNRHAKMGEAHLAHVQGLRASGGHGKHDSRPRRERTRATSRNAAMREGGW